ncbi:hypothetical protein B0H14DRAFT_3497008 [Mycena olivaceomarginata]|nr:hypothetical protein B0H14DRAFT_3497008 [Mycena olivaceomarginata]
MDEDLHLKPGFSGETTNDDHGSQYMGTFFGGAKHFVIEGGTFNINQAAPNNLPTYWARDPIGAEKLNAEEARILGFPDLAWRIEVMGGSWNSSVYHGIREFHEAKGFDVNGQDVAIELGYPLFHVSCTRDGLLSRLREIDADDEYSESEEVSGGEDDEPISVDAEDALDAETASDFESEMNDGPANVHDDEMMEGKSSWDLDADNQVHQGPNVPPSDRLEEDEVFAMFCC